jgi:magnesium and cobalt transporter
MTAQPRPASPALSPSSALKLQPVTPSATAPATEKASRLQMAVQWLRDKIGNKSEGSLKEIIEDALETDAAKETSISDEEKELLKNMIHFGELTVRDVMVPRTEILALKRSVSLDELKRHMIDIGHTRIPVYDESLDKVEGFIHVKDLFPYLTSGTHFDIGAVLREILFVPPSMRIVDLLLKMRVSGCHMAIVVDEYGGTSGLVTLEDLFEELVGEIQDEHDETTANDRMRWIGEVLEADARVKIGEVEEALNERLYSGGEDSADYDSLGGFIFYTLGRVPVKGEVIKIGERLKIEITAADPRRVRQVRITRLASQAMLPLA